MGVIQFNIPDDLKEAFEAKFKGAQADAMVLDFVRNSLAQQQPPAGREGLVERMRGIRARSTRTYTDDEIREARDELRR